MKNLIWILLALVAAFAVYYFVAGRKTSGTETVKDEPQKPIIVKKHSAEFNAQVDKIINSYLAVKDAFVDANIDKVKAEAQGFITALDSLQVKELDKNNEAVSETALASIRDIKSNAESMVKQTDITEMRRDFSSLTQVMYPAFFQTIAYEGEKLYIQNCPMAFNDDEEASWLSNSSEIMNPYLGNKHPKYKATMLHCGEVKDSIILKP